MKTGRLGEDAACRYLAGLGQTILERNWRSGHLEVDIITRDLNGLHFVEVKTLVAPMSAAPEEKVTRLKQSRITAAAQRYLHQSGHPEFNASEEVFFDVVSVIFAGDEVTINYFPQAYLPIYT